MSDEDRNEFNHVKKNQDFFQWKQVTNDPTTFSTNHRIASSSSNSRKCKRKTSYHDEEDEDFVSNDEDFVPNIEDTEHYNDKYNYADGTRSTQPYKKTKND